MSDQVFISYSSLDKPIADAVCHRLEEAGIRCWIAPRDIDSSDWAASIMDGLSRSRVYVVIISKNSIASPEVTKEVTEATRVCEYLLPFKVDDEVLPPRLQYHLGPCHWLDAVNPPMEQRIGELIDRIRNLSQDDAVYSNAQRLHLTEKISYPAGLFLGRSEEIASIRAMLSDQRVAFLTGMGGIGKSEIAKGYAREYRSAYDTIVFASYSGSLLDLVCSDEIRIEGMVRAENEPAELWFGRKITTLRRMTNDRTLLIIDNFDVDEDDRLQDLLTLPAHLLFTTRNDHSEYPTIAVGPIRDFDTVRGIFTHHYGRPVRPDEQEIVDGIIRLVNGHTITVELIAKQMRASFLKPAKMLERLESTGINTHLKEKVKREGTAEKQSSYDYICRLFDFSGISEDEKHLMEVMSFMPLAGIEIGLLGEILDLEDYDGINSLIGKSWLILDEDDDVIRMHPVIADVVREKLNPTPQSCRDLVHGWFGPGRDFWFKDMPERQRLYAVILPLLKRFPVPDPDNFDRYISFVNVMWMCGDFERSQTFAKGVYEYALSEFGPASEEAARAALVIAGAYHNAGDDIQSEPWYKKSVEHMLATGKRPTTAALAQGYMKIGRCACRRGDLETARENLARAGEEFQYLIDHRIFAPGWDTPDQYTDYFMDLYQLKMAEGDYEEGLRLATEHKKRIEDRFGIDSTSSMYPLMDMGECQSVLGMYDEAEQSLAESLRINLRANGPYSTQTLRVRELAADNELRRGNADKARELYTALELDLETCFGAENPLTQKIRGKKDSV